MIRYRTDVSKCGQVEINANLDVMNIGKTPAVDIAVEAALVYDQRHGFTAITPDPWPSSWRKQEVIAIPGNTTSVIAFFQISLTLAIETDSGKKHCPRLMLYMSEAKSLTGTSLRRANGNGTSCSTWTLMAGL